MSLPVFICYVWMWDHQFCRLPPPPPCHCHTMSSPLWLPVATRPTHMDEYFFFRSLVVRPAHSSMFWQFWLFFVLRLVVLLLMVVQGGKAWLYAPPSRPDVLHFLDRALWWTKVFDFDEIQYVFSFGYLCFWCHFLCLPNAGPQKCTPMYPSKCLYF